MTAPAFLPAAPIAPRISRPHLITAQGERTAVRTPSESGTPSKHLKTSGVEIIAEGGQIALHKTSFFFAGFGATTKIFPWLEAYARYLAASSLIHEQPLPQYDETEESKWTADVFSRMIAKWEQIVVHSSSAKGRVVWFSDGWESS
jgi:hypothetical protein